MLSEKNTVKSYSSNEPLDTATPPDIHFSSLPWAKCGEEEEEEEKKGLFVFFLSLFLLSHYRVEGELEEGDLT